MKPRIFINIHYLEIGGAERALLGLLSALDPEKVDIDLFVNQHTGEFMGLIPSHVNLLPEIPEYTAIERPIKDIIREGHIGIAIRRIIAKVQHNWFIQRDGNANGDHYSSSFQYVADAVDGGLPNLKKLGKYDLAISFLHPHNITLNKVDAKKKICWIHTDYSTIHINVSKELIVWNGFDYIASISKDCTNAFCKTFPVLQSKIIEIENILSPIFVRLQAETENIDKYIPKEVGSLTILSIGRYHPQKNFESIPYICSLLEKRGINFKWYIIGYGPDNQIQIELDKYKMRHRMILLGKKTNPYPYIKKCDIYVQPSRYEGKSVTVREAQILHKPVIITNYPTAKSQIQSGIDGIIVPMNAEAVADGITNLIKDKHLKESIISYLKEHDYGNESEVNKIYQLLS